MPGLEKPPWTIFGSYLAGWIVGFGDFQLGFAVYKLSWRNMRCAVIGILCEARVTTYQ